MVALCDNIYQGIYPVPPQLGNGDKPQNNLYWGAMYGVKTFLQKSKNWEYMGEAEAEDAYVLQRIVFKHKESGAILVADAYQGRKIKNAVADFVDFAAGKKKQEISIAGKSVNIGGGADFVVYVGHNGLMDFDLDSTPSNSKSGVDAAIFACYSKQYFKPIIEKAGATAMAYTSGKLAPEGYVVEAAASAWAEGQSKEIIREKAAEAYAKYQKISKGAAMKLFVNE